MSQNEHEQQQQQYQQKVIKSSPSDGISCLSFSGSDFLVASSWDGVRFYDFFCH